MSIDAVNNNLLLLSAIFKESMSDCLVNSCGREAVF